jgi:hypothetical protein
MFCAGCVLVEAHGVCRNRIILDAEHGTFQVTTHFTNQKDDMAWAESDSVRLPHHQVDQLPIGHRIAAVMKVL